jgi:DNA-directed RNA polymerase specialized sigma24 family protein
MTTDLPISKSQREILLLRYERGATIDQISEWLRINRRSVIFRLRRAERQALRGKAPRSSLPDTQRRRTYSATKLQAG